MLEWAWGEVLSVEVVPNWRGVAMRLREDADRRLVIGNVFHTFLVRPGPVTLAAGWLKVQGAWSEWRGDRGVCGLAAAGERRGWAGGEV